MSYDLKGKVALITGASSGIGAATAVLFARCGAKLALTGRNETNLQRTCDDCVRVLPAADDDDAAQRPLLIVADVCCEPDVVRLVDATVAKFGRLDVLVNSAGVAEFDSIETTSLAQYDRVMAVNARAAFRLTTLCVPHLVATRGNVVSVSSINATCGFPGDLVYSMSKAALDQMTSCAALELAARGVRVNAVNPGVVVTDIHRRSGMSDDQLAAFLERQRTVHPLGRVGDVDEVARAIGFLASSDAAFITGEHLHIDGGRHAACLR